jgi:hypothetical protein
MTMKAGMGKSILLVGFAFGAVFAHAEQTQTGLNSEIQTQVPANSRSQVPAAILREVLTDMTSAIFQGSFIGSNVSPIEADGSKVVVQNSSTTASAIYAGINPPGVFYNDVTRSVGVLTPASTVTNFNGFGSYLLNNVSSTGNASNAVNFFSIGISNVDGAATWGANFALNDTTDNASTATSKRDLNGIELDFTVASRNAGTHVQGVGVILNGLYGNISSGDAFQVATTSNSHARWGNSFVSADGVTSGAALYVGARAKSGSSVNSQPIKFNRFDNRGTEHADALLACHAITSDLFRIKASTVRMHAYGSISGAGGNKGPRGRHHFVRLAQPQPIAELANYRCRIPDQGLIRQGGNRMRTVHDEPCELRLNHGVIFGRYFPMKFVVFRST